MEKDDKNRSRRRDFRHKAPTIDEEVMTAIKKCETELINSLKPAEIRSLNGFQRKQVYRYFDRSKEYRVKSYREENEYVIKLFPIGALKRLAEQKAQEVIMTGEHEVLSPMGSFERYVIHDYLKDRGGVKTESHGEGQERHIEIQPIFGRTLKKAKRRLT